eukprot:TRINITY_DN7135_c0_g1_i3.p1 TRINITY_DN7135_c0_g1~~TRINITY_DN7135_c0_g1_i3.p1  ORF type:complete len:174 (+),score=35.04 TRINITY_DN7135_c0_g1_i3:107-628(+)
MCIRDSLQTEGIFRIPGSAKITKQWVSRMNTDPEFDLAPPSAEFTVPSVASLVVRFLMGQPSAWWSGGTGGDAGSIVHDAGRIAMALRAGEDRAASLAEARGFVEGLAPSVRETLRTVAGLMHLIAQNEEVTLMTAPKLAMCVGSTVGPLAEVLFEEYEYLFEGSMAQPNALG